LSISASASSSGDDTEAWLKKMATVSTQLARLESFGAAGVAALRAATPVESGETANAWFYQVIQEKGTYSLVWGNNHVEDGRQIAVLLQYGHGTRNAGYVQGRDYINPALRPIFDQAVAEGWKVVIQ
jgi:hypothetical protein